MPSAVKQTGENLLRCTGKLTGADLVLFNLADIGGPIRPGREGADRPDRRQRHRFRTG
jgi:hypothetical protein